MVSKLLPCFQVPLSLICSGEFLFVFKGFLDWAPQLMSAKRESKISLLGAKKVVTTHTQNRTALLTPQTSRRTAYCRTYKIILFQVGKVLVQLTCFTQMSKERKKQNKELVGFTSGSSRSLMWNMSYESSIGRNVPTDTF